MLRSFLQSRLPLCAAMGMFCAAAFFATFAAASDRECKLELIRMEAPRPGFNVPREEHPFRNVTPQRFTLSMGRANAYNPFDKPFKENIKKEPAKYVADAPFRGVALLAGKTYVFVLDKKSATSPGFDVLYFDVNGNGDLTDDEAIRAYEQPQAEKPEGQRAAQTRLQQSWSYFPRVDLKLDFDGAKVDYSFFFQVFQQQRMDFSYVMATLTAAAYQRGEASIDGRRRAVVLLDNNSNGRFDDVFSMPRIPNVRGRIRPAFGDSVLIGEEQDAAGGPRPGAAAWNSQYLAKLLILDGKYYDVTVSTSGDEIAWSPSSLPGGQVVGPRKNCTVMLIGELGCIPLTLRDAQPATVPAGQWRVFNYSITDTEWAPPNAEKPADADAARPRPAPSVVSGWGAAQMEPIEVRAGETAQMNFGPPYKLALSVYHMPGEARFAMAIQGETGETVASLSVNGRRPQKPKLTITDQSGEVVAEGDFEYG